MGKAQGLITLLPWVSPARGGLVLRLWLGSHVPVCHAGRRWGGGCALPGEEGRLATELLLWVRTCDGDLLRSPGLWP